MRNNDDFDIYAQRIDGNGLVQWTIDGEPICTAIGYQNTQQITTDGFGGAFIAWSDGRNGGQDSDIYIQRINLIGTVQFPTNGFAVCTASYFQGSPQLVSDGNNGVIVSWNDSRSNDGFADIYAQRISSTGFKFWSPANGVLICNANNNQNDPKIVADGSGGAIICWFDNRNGNSNIYAQKISTTGVNQWTENGVSICSANFYQGFQQIISDNAGGAYITWEDRRFGRDIYAQRINTNGFGQWTTDGIAVCTSVEVQEVPQLCANNAGNIIITWQDNYTNIFAQSISPNGIALWNTNGVVVSIAQNNSQSNPQVVLSVTNDVIIAWDSYRTGADIYASKLSSSGTLPTKSFSKTSKISLFPNPVNSILTIQNIENNSIDKISITDLTGKKVLEQNTNYNNINVENLRNGMYLLQIFTDGNSTVLKFIKN